MSPSPLELGIVGTGAAALEHARVLSRMNAPVRCHFASRDFSRAAEAAARVPGSEASDGVDALLSGETSAVLVATPPTTHRELAMRALAAGKHVVVEKPAFPSVEDFDAVASAATEAGRLVLVAENYRYKPAVARLRRIVESGAIGDVLLVAVTALKRQQPEGWRADPALVGGGPLLEGGVHWISLMTDLGLTVADVAAHPIGLDGGGDSLLLTFAYREGAVGSLAFSWDAWSPLGGVRLSRIYGRRGSVVFESNGAFVAALGRRPSLMVSPPSELSGHRAMWRAFLDRLADGDDPEDSLGRARRDVELVHRAYEQVRRAGPMDRGGHFR